MEDEEGLVLPGTHLDLDVKCPCCGWNFALGLRKLPSKDPEGDDADGKAVLVCGKCINAITFNIADGSEARVMTEEELLELPIETQRMLALGQYLAELAQERNKGMMQ